MKKYLWLPLLLMAVIGSSALTTKAQSTYSVRANVPFDFIVGDKTLPAGKICAREMYSTNSGALAISNFEKGKHAIRIAHPLTTSWGDNRGKLVFRKYGNQYYLAEVWRPGYIPLGLNKSKSERDLKRKNTLAENSTPEIVTIMADLQ